MNIKVIEKSYDEISHINGFKYKKPKRRSLLFNYLIRILSFTELKKTNFKYTMVNMDKLPKKPCLVLMNHSSFIDGKILFKILKSKKFNIITARDSYIQKDLLMRTIGCIPTNKFMNDLQLIKDIQYCLNDLKSSVVLFPEAGYSFDGTKTVLPKSLGKLCKLLKVPVISIITSGAYTNNPLYNNLKRRKVDISAKVNLLFNEEDINNLSIDEINSKINNEFSFDAFKWQLENKIKITEDFRADSLNRILYKCPHCLTEGKMVGQGIELTCKHCGKTHILNEYGQLEGKDFTPIFSHIPDWYKWQREEVKKEILEDKYNFESEVDLFMLVDTKCFYNVGKGILKHNKDGIHLISNDGKIEFSLPSKATYTLNCDLFFYEIGDTISFGDSKKLFYCFPPKDKDVVTKVRLAAEELYKLNERK